MVSLLVAIRNTDAHTRFYEIVLYQIGLSIIIGSILG
jgi:hypothetical protein